MPVDLIDPARSQKRCIDCDKKSPWSAWFCHHCGGRLIMDEPERFRAKKGVNRVLTVINDRPEDLIIHVPPKDVLRVQPGQILNIPVAQDANTLFRALPNGELLIGARQYAESGEDVKRFLEG